MVSPSVLQSRRLGLTGSTPPWLPSELRVREHVAVTRAVL